MLAQRPCALTLKFASERSGALPRNRGGRRRCLRQRRQWLHRGFSRRRLRLRRAARLSDHPLHRQPVRRREVEVALVVRRHRHDGARAVRADDVVRHPDGQPLAGQRVHDALSRRHARLCLGARPIEVRLARRLRYVLCDCRVALSGASCERVLWRNHNVRRAHQRVGARGEDAHVLPAALGRKADLRPLGPADPRPLHRHRPLWPVEPVELCCEPVGERSDLEHPLPQRLALHREASALREAVDDLLVGEHRAEAGAPVDRLLVLEGEALLEELEEDPLRPLDVPHVRRGELALPVVREAQRAELPLEVCNVLLGRHLRVRARVHRVLLGGQAKRVPPHRVQHVVVAHPPVASHDVGRRVALWVPDVQPGSRRVRKHVEHVLLLLALAAARGEGSVRFPVRLPLGLDRQVVGHAALARAGRRRRRRRLGGSRGLEGALHAAPSTGGRKYGCAKVAQTRRVRAADEPEQADCRSSAACSHAGRNER
mmetsp:Transcript_34161/g.113987  ORF Transcript_34161/g.113987 Transcript_34161/m.113987 type:complete len:486 (+) Transcript_34161:46-1503(+)